MPCKVGEIYKYHILAASRAESIAAISVPQWQVCPMDDLPQWMKINDVFFLQP